MACGLDIRIVRWWDPSPVFGPLSRARLDHGSGVLARLYAAAGRAPGLAGHGMAGQERLEPAASRLLAAPQGADLAWGLVAGCRAALLLSVS